MKGISKFLRQSRAPRPSRHAALFSTSSFCHEKHLINASELPAPESPLPDQAKVVICGGGAQGAAIAYKLAQRGFGPDTVLLEQGTLGGGTTWHSSGLISLMKHSTVETKLGEISKNLYLELEEKGYYTGWKECGSISVARTKDRLHHLKRMKSASTGRSFECEIVTPDRIQEICPIIRTDDLEGGLWIPGDGVANPLEICLALANLAAEMGVRIVPHCGVEEIVAKDGAVDHVRTNKGVVKCEFFINSAGFWARHVGNKSTPRVNVPMHPAEHYYIHTKPIPDLPPNNPVVRDMDGHIYFRENEGRFLGGGFEPIAKPAFEDGVMPDSMATRELPVDWDHFFVLLDNLLHRVPSIGAAKLERLTNGPEAFSPDGNWIMGQAPEIKNYLVAAAMRSIGIGAAGGVGEIMADYVSQGRSSFEMYNLDIQRFLPMHNNRKFLRDRVKEVPGLIYSIPYPFQEYKTGRALRTSPIFPLLRDLGARFNQVMGYERAMYFEKDSTAVDYTQGYVEGDSDASSLNINKTDTFYKPHWFNVVAEEFAASRETVSLTDYSSFAKMDLWSGGTEVVDFLQRLCSNDVDIPIGQIIHTGMQNEAGGYANDCSLARLAENRFMLMSPSYQQMRSYTWMKHRLPQDGSVDLVDVTSLYTTLCLMGPKAPDLLAKLTSDPVDSKSFPFFTCRHMDIACAPDILTMNITHTGELGFVFYIPNETAVHVFDSIVEAGKEFGIRQCGYYAMRALRIEKFYAFWGQDLDSNSTPVECGRSFRAKMKSDIDFIGKAAMQKQIDEGIFKMLVMLIFDPLDHDKDTDPWPWGGEPIFRDGVFCGRITTASYGFSLQRHVAIGFVNNLNDKGDRDYVTPGWIKSGSYEVEVAGVRYPVEVRINPPRLPTKVQIDTGNYEPTRHQT